MPKFKLDIYKNSATVLTMKATTLKNLIAKRNALNAEINRLKKGKIEAGDIVYLKKNKNDDFDFDLTHHVDTHYNNCGRVEFKVVKVKGNKITIKDIEGVNDWNTKTFDIARVFICKNPTAENRIANEIAKENEMNNDRPGPLAYLMNAR
jgi:hypothetical protein